MSIASPLATAPLLICKWRKEKFKNAQLSHTHTHTHFSPPHEVVQCSAHVVEGHSDWIHDYEEDSHTTSSHHPQKRVWQNISNIVNEEHPVRLDSVIHGNEEMLSCI